MEVICVNGFNKCDPAREGRIGVAYFSAPWLVRVQVQKSPRAGMGFLHSTFPPLLVRVGIEGGYSRVDVSWIYKSAET